MFSIPEKGSSPGKRGKRFLADCRFYGPIILAWLCTVVASAQNDNDLLDTTYHILTSLPVPAVRAVRLLKMAEEEFKEGSIIWAEVTARCERAIRLAAKETRDAYYNMYSEFTEGTSALRAYAPISDWSDLAVQAETARKEANYDETLRLYAELVKQIKPFRDLKDAARQSEDMTSEEALRLMLAAAEAGLDLEVLTRGEKGDLWLALRRRTLPDGFEIVPDPRPALPVTQTDTDYGLELAAGQSGALFEVLPWKIRSVPDFFSPGVPPITLLLIPPGHLYFPDDKDDIRELYNPEPFYMAAEETCWGWLADFYTDLSENERKALKKSESETGRILAESSPDNFDRPAVYTGFDMAEDFCNWLNQTRDEEKDNADPRYVFEPANVERWRFAACLDLLAHFMQEPQSKQKWERPSYQWWKELREDRGWNIGILLRTGLGDQSGWGFYHLFGNAAEWAPAEEAGSPARRCGGSFREVADPIISFPLHDHREARSGEKDLGFRLVLIPLFSGEWAKNKRVTP